MNRFTKHEVMRDHIAEALELFENFKQGEALDYQCHYLVGKFYQEEKDVRKAYGVYLNAIKRFNKAVQKNPSLRSENEELAYSFALNLMTLQSNPVDPEVEVCFKIIKKSFPLHLKRIEFENEMAKPAPDKLRIKQLAEEIRKLRDDDEKETAAAAPKTEQAKPTAAEPQQPQVGEIKASPAVEVAKDEKPAELKPPEPKPGEPKGIFSKLFNELSPAATGLSGLKAQDVKNPKSGGEKTGKIESFVIAPNRQEASFMTFHNNQWEGPYTLTQIRTMGFLERTSWVCRTGSQQVIQAYEVPDLQPLFQK